MKPCPSIFIFLSRSPDHSPGPSPHSSCGSARSHPPSACMQERLISPSHLTRLILPGVCDASTCSTLPRPPLLSAQVTSSSCRTQPSSSCTRLLYHCTLPNDDVTRPVIAAGDVMDEKADRSRASPPHFSVCICALVSLVSLCLMCDYCSLSAIP